MGVVINLQELQSSKHPQISVDQTPLAGGGYEAAMSQAIEGTVLNTKVRRRTKLNSEVQLGCRSDEK